MLIKFLAASTAFAAIAAAAPSALACEEQQGPCGGPPPVHAMGPAMRGPAVDAYIASPGPTPAYKAGESYSESTTTYEDRGYGEHRGGAAHYDRYGGEGARGGAGWGGRYGEVRKTEGYTAPYTPAFGHTVTAERPYDGPGTGYMVQHGPCAPCAAPPPPPLPAVRHRVVRRVYRHAAHVVRHVTRVHTRVIKRVVIERVIEREVPRYIDRPVIMEREVDSRVSPDFFYGGINGGAGFGVDGGTWGGGGGGYSESGASAGSMSFSYASATANASSSSKSKSWTPSPHGMPPKGKDCGCNGKSGGGKWGGGGKH